MYLPFLALLAHLLQPLHAAKLEKNEFSMAAQTCFTNIASLKENKHINHSSELFAMACEEDVKNKKASCAILLDKKKKPELMEFSFMVDGSKKIYIGSDTREHWIIDSKTKRFYSTSSSSFSDLNAFLTKNCAGVVIDK